MAIMKNIIISFLRKSSGTTAIEYSVIALVIAIAAITGMALVGDNLGAWWDYIGDEWSKVRN